MNNLNFHNYGDFLGIENDLTKNDIHAMLAIENIQRIQTDKPLNPQSYQLLNQHYFSQHPEVGFRAFGFYSENKINLDFCQYLSNIEHFWLDNYDNLPLHNIDAIQNLSKLKSLKFHADKFDFDLLINSLSENLNSLHLFSEKTKIDIKPLLKFQQLQHLYLHGLIKNITDISHFSQLKSLNFQGLSLSNLAFINPLKNLETLSISWGKTQDFSALYGNETIKNLKLWRINNFTDEHLFSQLPNLQRLQLTDLKHITGFGDLRNHENLKLIKGDNLKSLVNFSTLEFVKSLESVVIACCPTELMPADILPILKNPNVKNCAIRTNSTKKNAEIKALIAEYGKTNDFYYKLKT